MSKFRTLKLYLVRNYNLKSVLSYDIIIPKSNKYHEFLPLIELAEKEIENLDKEGGGDDDSQPVTEDELKEFVDEYAYQQAIIDIVTEGDSQEEDDNRSKDTRERD